MARLIDADALLDRMRVVTMDSTCPLHIAGDIEQEIELAPTVDAVEVVRCKYCKHWQRHTDRNLDQGSCWRNGWHFLVTRNEGDFCSYGERSEGE